MVVRRPCSFTIAFTRPDQVVPGEFPSLLVLASRYAAATDVEDSLCKRSLCRSELEPLVAIDRSGFKPEVAVRISTEGSLPTASPTPDGRASQITTRPSGLGENRANWRFLGALARSPVVIQRKKGPVPGPFWRCTRRLPPRADWLAESIGFEPEVALCCLHHCWAARHEMRGVSPRLGDETRRARFYGVLSGRSVAIRGDLTSSLRFRR